MNDKDKNKTERILVYGGKGILGAKCIRVLKRNKYWVGSIDFTESIEADFNIIVATADNLIKQESTISDALNALLGDEFKMDAIICTTNGCCAGNTSKDLVKKCELMWQQSGWTATISAALAVKYLKPDGLVVFVGSKLALEPTPMMIGYGLTKTAVHHLTASLGGDNSGLPKDAIVVALLPVCLDTPGHRRKMPDADFSTWTPLEFVADLLLRWIKKMDRPKNGSLCQLCTKDNRTEVVELVISP